MRKIILLSVATVIPLAASAQIVYTENFDVDNSANWQFFSSTAGDLAGDGSNNDVNFFFDYSSVGIPLAPGGGNTRGMRMQANIIGSTAVQRGMSASPLNQSFTGDYTLTFDAWLNYHGPLNGGGNGSTHVTMGGIGATNSLQFVGTSFNGAGFGTTGDGGSGNDWRAQLGVGAIVAETSGAYAAGNVAGVTNNTHPYYSGFGGASAPAAQLALFPGQTGVTPVGTTGFSWRQWRIEKVGNSVTWFVDNLRIATVTDANADGGSNIFFAQYDINATVSNDPLSAQLQFGLIDNIQVEVVPEPGTLAALGLGAAALLRRRKKA